MYPQQDNILVAEHRPLTISTTTNSAYLAGTGSQYTFNYSFIADEAVDVSVYYIDATGNQTLLSPTQYTLVINAASPNQLWGIGGTITYPLAGPAIAAGTYLFLQRTLPLTQETSVQNQGNYYTRVTEQALDILEMQIQQVAARTGLLRGTWATGLDYSFGDMVVDGANGANTGNYYLCVVPNLSTVWATQLAAGDWSLSINTQQIAAYAASATASASTATIEAGVATTEAGIATTQATSATASAAAASVSASNASTSETNAAASATSASTSATSATASATTATTQAGIATTQATSASTSATNAATSATNAATSATSAASSATAAGSTLTATSTTSNTIGTGNFTFTTQANKNFALGQPVMAASMANGANYIHGYVNSYSGTTLIITETDIGGSGTRADWSISASGPQGPSGGGTGTVTSASVVSANGLAGTVANPTTTPAITLTTTVTGLLKGNGTALSAASAGTDYLTPTGNGSGLTTLTAANISAGTAGISVTGNAATVTTINGRMTAGTNTTLAGSGTSGSPYAVTTPTATSSTLGVVKPDNTTITISAGIISAAGGAVNSYQLTPANPTGTSSATLIMMGLLGAFTPVGSGKVRITITGSAAQSSTTGTIGISPKYGTGTAPINGAANTGTLIGAVGDFNPSAQGGNYFPFTVQGIVTLTPSTAYWIDVALSNSNALTSSIRNVCITAYELK